MADNTAQFIARTIGGLAACTKLVGDELDALAFSALCASVGLCAVLHTEIQPGEAEQTFFAAIDGITGLTDILVACTVLNADALLTGVRDALFALRTGFGNRSGASPSESLEDQVAGTARSARSIILTKADIDEGRTRSTCIAGRTHRTGFNAEVAASCGVLETLESCIARSVGTTRRPSRAGRITAGLIATCAFASGGTLKCRLAGQILGARFTGITTTIALANAVACIAQQATFAIAVRFAYRAAHTVVGDALLETGCDLFATEVFGTTVICIADLKTTTAPPFGVFAIISTTISIDSTGLAKSRFARGKLDRACAVFAGFTGATLRVLGTGNRGTFHLVGKAVFFAV